MRQMSGIGTAISNMLVNAEFTCFSRIQNANPRELELVSIISWPDK